MTQIWRIDELSSANIFFATFLYLYSHENDLFQLDCNGLTHVLKSRQLLHRCSTWNIHQVP